MHAASPTCMHVYMCTATYTPQWRMLWTQLKPLSSTHWGQNPLLSYCWCASRSRTILNRPNSIPTHAHPLNGHLVLIQWFKVSSDHENPPKGLAELADRCLAHPLPSHLCRCDSGYLGLPLGRPGPTLPPSMSNLNHLLVVSWSWFRRHRSPVLSGLGNMELLFGPALSVALVLMARVNDCLLASRLVQTDSVVVQLRVRIVRVLRCRVAWDPSWGYGWGDRTIL